MKKILLVLLVFLSSCVSTNIRSNKANYNEKIDKLLVIMEGSDSTVRFISSLKKSLKQSFEEKGVDVDFHYIDPIALNSEQDKVNKLKAFNPNLIMYIQQTEIRQSNYYEYNWGTCITGGTYNIQLMKPNSKSLVWRANLSANTTYGIEYAGEKAGNTLIEKLVVDKLL